MLKNQDKYQKCDRSFLYIFTAIPNVVKIIQKGGDGPPVGMLQWGGWSPFWQTFHTFMKSSQGTFNKNEISTAALCLTREGKLLICGNLAKFHNISFFYFFILYYIFTTSCFFVVRDVKRLAYSFMTLFLVWMSS